MFAIYYSGEPDTVRSPKAWHLHNARRDHKPKIKSIGSNGKYDFILLIVNCCHLMAEDVLLTFKIDYPYGKTYILYFPFSIL